jgi:cytochrome c5
MKTRALPALLAALIAAATLGGLIEAARGPNPYRGKSVFKSTCKACHKKDGEAANLTPMSKTIAQWEGFFHKQAPACLKKVQAKTGKALTADETADMKFFLVSHAADSDQPETCGE